MKNLRNLILAMTLATMLLAACGGAEGNETGHEYMPDMAHSIAYEANVYNYYYQNTWDSASVIKLEDAVLPRKPVDGTVPRGYAGLSYSNGQLRNDNTMAYMDGSATPSAIAIPLNGSVPYNYPDTEEGRAEASRDLVGNPFPITKEGLERGKELYTIFCAICHGKNGAGEEGGIYASGIYPAAPANMLIDTFLNSNNGRFYHAIMYGKNVMGAYKDKISYEERYQVIHYIRSLQAKATETAYNETTNTLNPAYGTPAAEMPQVAAKLEGITPEPMKEGESTPAGLEGDSQGNDPATGGEDHGGEHHSDGMHSNEGEGRR